MKRRYAVITAILIISHFSLCAKSSEDEAFPQNSSSRQEKAAVTWHNFNEGIRQAREKRRPVVMDFYADWCGWCKKMEADVFSSAHVASKLNDNYICIRVYMDKDPNETIRYKNHTLSKQEFTAMLGIQGLPTIVFMDRDADLITKIPGYISKKVFLSLLGYIDEECYIKKISFNDYVEGKTPCGKKK